jgi:hypothetical protein
MRGWAGMAVCFAGVTTPLSVGCTGSSEPALVLPDVAGVARTYFVAECPPFAAGGLTAHPPCLANFSASTQTYIDSGQLVLKRDHTLTWSIAGKQTSNPCYLMGTQCATTTIQAWSSTGTYTIVADTMFLHLDQQIAFGSNIRLYTSGTPTRVPPSWEGPPYLDWHIFSAYSARFKPSD